MQEAEEKTIGQQARSGSEAKRTPASTQPPYRSPAEPLADGLRSPGETDRPASPTNGPASAKILDQLSPGARDLDALTCGCYNHRQLKRWLQSYLKQNAPEQSFQRNAGTLRSLLAEITRWTAPARIRLASLEVLRPVIASHASELSLLQLARDRSGSVVQTPDQRRDLLTAVILYQHLAQAYSSICVQLLSEPHTLFYRRRLARVLHRGIDSYRRLIQISSHFYLAPPKGSWARIQRLVALAREQKLDQRRVLDPLAADRPTAQNNGSTASLTSHRWVKLTQPYLHSALFASANPLQLTVEEQLQLWLCCARWANGARLLERVTPSLKTLLASLRLDQPPIPSVRLQHSNVDMKYFSAPLGWTIDLSNPLRQLQRRLHRPGAISPDVLHRVQDTWAGGKSRETKRTPVNIRCEVVTGLSAIGHHLKNGGDEAPELANTFAAPAADSLVMEVDTIDFRTGRPLKDYEVSLHDQSSRALPSAPSVSRKSNSDGVQKRYQPIPATLLNSSASGAGLRMPPDCRGRLKTGDLIALRVKDHWELALVRWQFGLPDQCRSGVELLGGHTSAVRVRRYSRDGRRTDPMVGLLTGHTGQVAELILPAPLFQPGDTVDIINAGQTRSVTLHKQTLATGSFSIFEFS